LDTIVQILTEVILKIAILFLISISLRFILQLTGQTWIKTTSHTATLTILPIVTFFITSVISGNIALSLGMVGALSIVRFRNPVRSPLELTVYFTAITLGITASVNLKWLILFGLTIYLIVFLLFLISSISDNYFKKQFFISSFSEGNSLSTLEIVSSKKIKNLDKSKLVKSISYSKAGNIQYLLASNNFNLLREMSSTIEQNEYVISYQLNEC
tara:strand:+ start:303 stop:944 length:642 start_codon:yes stop_codon:yes gene_type:complete